MPPRRRTVTWLLPAAGLLCIAALAVAAALSRARPVDTGLVAGSLRPCPDTPNCVASEAAGAASRVAPLALPPALSADAAWTLFARLVAAHGGRILVHDAGYLHAVYHSRWLRFADDLEARLDGPRGVIQVRAAARVGYSDLGANRRRVEHLRSALRHAAGDG